MSLLAAPTHALPAGEGQERHVDKASVHADEILGSVFLGSNGPQHDTTNIFGLFVT